MKKCRMFPSKSENKIANIDAFFAIQYTTVFAILAIYSVNLSCTNFQ